MRILYVTQIVPYPPHGGVLQRGFNLVRELGRGHDVHLLAFHHPDELPPGEKLEESRRELGKVCRSVDYFELWPKRSRAHMLMAFGAGALYPEPFSVLAHRSAALAEKISAICSGNQKPDVVHLDTIGLAPYARFCNGIPIVLTHHNIESQLMERRALREEGTLRKAYTNLQARRLRDYEARQAGRFAVNICVSDADAEQLREICPAAKTAVVPNGVDTDYFHPRWGNETPTLIYTGGMNMFANKDAVEWFLDDIWPRIKQAVPEAQFIAIGQRPSPRVLEAAARDSAVQAPGFVPDVRPSVARAAVYVVPLRVGGGTRLKMVDAMAQGKAIVATSLGAEGIVGTDREHFLLADDAASFAEKTIALLKQPEERSRLGKAARARAEQVYKWSALARSLVAAYEQATATSVRSDAA